MKRTIFVFISLLFFCSCRTTDRKPKGLFPIKEFSKWGYVNSEGKTVIKCQFDWAGPFSNGRAAFLRDTLYGFIDTTGSVVIEPKFREVAIFSGGFCNVKFQKDTLAQNAFIRTDGSVAFVTPYEVVSSFNDGRATVNVNGEVCVIDKSGKIVFNTHCSAGSEFYEGIIRVWGGRGGWAREGNSSAWKGDTTKYYDTSGHLIGVFEGMGYEDFSDGLALVRIDNRPCFIDRTGKVVVEPKNPDLNYFSFSDGFAKVAVAGRDSKAGFIDKTGSIVIPVRFSYVCNFKEELGAFRDEKGWGFIDKKGRIVIPQQFEEIELNGFSNGLCRVKQNHQWGYINHKGEFVWKEQVGLAYTQLDLSKWKLDTLQIDEPFTGGKYAGRDNYPRKKNFPSLSGLTLKIDTTDLTVFGDKFFAYKIYLINATTDTVNIPAQDGVIRIIQQAKNKNGAWQDIENFYNSFCGNSYHKILLAPSEFQLFATPIFKGEFKTQLRFKLELNEQIIYSNPYTGQINLKQFLNPKDKDKTEAMVWTN